MNWYINVLKKYAVFSGRASRSEYWYFVLINTIITFILIAIGNTIGNNLLDTIYSLAVFIPTLAVTARRLHDIGKSGWWQLLLFVPILGFIILIIFLVKNSMPFENEYGPDPKESNSTDFNSPV
ncbi:MAG: DUF805 domain-containing protein [Sulfurospirillum sp.]